MNEPKPIDRAKAAADRIGRAQDYLSAHPGEWFSRAQVIGMLAQHEAREPIQILWGAPWVVLEQSPRPFVRCTRCQAGVDVFLLCPPVTPLFATIERFRAFHRSHAACPAQSPSQA